MIRFMIIIFSVITLNSFAFSDDEGGKKKIDTEHGIEHPDHIPHGHEKSPLKKVGHNDGLTPRKRKKLRVA